MKITFIKLPRSERFACAKRDIRLIFESVPLEADFGRSHRYFSKTRPWRSKYLANPWVYYSPPAEFSGVAVAALMILQRADQAPRGWLRLYAVRREEYPDDAVSDFIETVLPQMKAWLRKKIAAGEGAHEDLVAEWNRTEHALHCLRYRVRRD